MLFQLVQVVYWIALSMWFGGAMFIWVAVQVIHRTVREHKPILPHVLSVNLEGEHSTLLSGAIAGNLIAALAKIDVVCAGLFLIALIAQLFLIDLSDAVNRMSAFVRSALFLAATILVVYDAWFLLPKIIKSREIFVENADDPEKANPAREKLDRLQRESETLLMILVFLLLGIILYSGGLREAAHGLSSGH